MVEIDDESKNEQEAVGIQEIREEKEEADRGMMQFRMFPL
jgi:hypothetical protein